MSAIKTIRMHNLQAIQDAYIELPERGLVVFVGDNSNGKTTLGRVLNSLVSGKLNLPSKRRSLVNRTVQEGSLELAKYDGSSLLVNINLESSLTYVQLTRKNGQVVRRYIADKTIPELVMEFGFHYSKERDISLNLFDSDKGLIFVTTNHVTNGDVLETALIDRFATQRAEQYRELYKEAMVVRKTYMENLSYATAERSGIQLYDIDKEKAIRDKANYYRNILQHIYIPNIKEAKPIPTVVYVKVLPIKISTFKIPLIISLPDIKLWNLDKAWKDFQSIEKGVCPTCLRPFSLCQTCTNEI